MPWSRKYRSWGVVNLLAIGGCGYITAWTVFTGLKIGNIRNLTIAVLLSLFAGFFALHIS